MTAHELLAYLAPPIELLDHLDRYQAKAPLPDSIVAWLERWQAIRSAGATPLDGLAPTVWAEAGKLAKQEKVY